MRIGLLGGSFNPPHRAHREISLFAIKRLNLDRVWWLVTPGNPLKDRGALRDLDERAKAARQIANDPRIEVTCLEAVIGTRYTVDTIAYLRRRTPGLRLVWIMGADNLAQFHRWQHWQRIASAVPIAVIDRPPQSFRPVSHPRKPGRKARGQARTSLGFSDRPETKSVVDGVTEPGRELEEVSGGVTGILKPLTPHA
jgi:nicotinate-nucleotide adenylyltransferase